MKPKTNTDKNNKTADRTDLTSPFITAEEYLSDVLTAFRVRELILEKNVTEKSPRLSEIDLNYREQLFVDYDYYLFFKQMTAQVSPGQPAEFRDEFGFLYFVFMHRSDGEPASAAADPDSLVYHICGPYLYELPYQPEEPQSFERFASERNIPESNFRQVKAHFSRLPLIKDMLAWRMLMERAMRLFLRNDFSFRVVRYTDSLHPELYEPREFTVSSNLDFDAIEARYAAEHRMLDAIKAGNVEDALKYHNQFMGFRLEDRGTTALSSAKWYVNAANTVFRKAVEEAQVHPLYIDALSGKFITDIETASSLIQLSQINVSMVRKYCLLVQTYSRKQYSELIRNCLNYIDFCYQEKLSLLFLAEKFSVSKNYLSTLFHNEVRMTVTDYINTTRIRQAILLLNTTSLPMQEIAEKCGFSDANYFTRTFKKIQGMSPLQYRKSILRG